MATINQLSYTDTFKTWFDRTNSIISTVNGITAYNLLAGDGIGITSSSNIFTISHGTLVNTGVTFAGNVKFNGTVSFASSPTVSNVVIGVTPKTSGITAGNIVRINGGGLTLAKADSSINSEVLGIVVGEDASSNIVAVAGAINNTTFASTIANILGVTGGTLAAGQVYFLSPTTAGKVTTTEPTTINQVSKPILLGITTNQAAILPYRGSLIGISAGLSGGYIGDSKIIVTVDYTTVDPSYPPTEMSILSLAAPDGSSVKVGDIVSIFSDYVNTNYTDVWNSGIVSDTVKLYGKCNNSSTTNTFIYDATYQMYPNTVGAPTLSSDGYMGMISRIVQNDTANKILTVEITLPGGIFEVNSSDLDSNLWQDVLNTNSQFVNFTFDRTIQPVTSTTLSNNDKNEWGKLIKTTNNKVIIAVYDPNTKIPKTEYLSDITKQIQTVATNPVVPTNNNLLINPTFAVQQYNQGITLTNSPTSEYVTPIIDGWYFTSCGITYTNLSVSGTTGNTIDLKVNYTLDPLNYPWRTFMTRDSSPSSVTGAAYSNISLVMKPAIENIQLISNETYPDCPYYFTFTVQTGATVDSSFSGITVYPFVNTYSKTPPTSGYTCGITGEMAFRGIVKTVYIPANQTTTVATSVPSVASSAAFSKLTGINNSNGIWFPHGTTLSVSQITNYHGTNNWMSFGVAFDPSTVSVKVTTTRLTRGSYAPSTNYFYDANYEYNKCKPYYQRSYPVNVSTGTSSTTPTFTRILVGNINTYPYALINFPIQMCRDPIYCQVYSLAGISGEAKNNNCNVDTYQTGGLLKNVPWDLTGVRTAFTQGNNIGIGGMDKNGFYIELNGGIETLDTIDFHWVADSRFKDSM